MEEIKPCPFCGGKAKVMRDKYSGVYFVGCSNDMCLGFSALGWTYETTGEAIAAWNTRAERTCNPIWKPNEWGFANAYCECGALLLRVANGLGESLPHYCPNCGTKVVS